MIVAFRRFLLLAAAALAGWTGIAAAQEEVRPLEVLLVTGGCCHDYDAQKEMISRGLKERARVNVTVVQQGGTATTSRIPLYEKEDWSKGFDVVIHDECFADVKDPDWTARILKPHKEGLPAVLVHCAMHCYRDGTEEWFKFCGVTSHRHGAHYPHAVDNKAPDHPIMQGFGESWANPAGELYWIEKVWPTATPLASSRNKEKGNEEVCVWTNTYFSSRVFATTLGHHNETVSSDAFLDLLTRGLLWSCDKLNSSYLKSDEAAAGPARWEKEIQQFEQADRRRSGDERPVDVVFLGSSSIRLWPLEESFPKLAVLNRGFGGSQMADAAEFAGRILASHRPKAVVVYSGDNDIAAGKSPEQVLSDFERLTKEVRKRVPSARIVVVSIKPSIKRWKFINTIRKTNGLLENACENGENMAFVDVASHMVGADGMPRRELLDDDELHLSPAGYRLWSRLTSPLLLGEKAAAAATGAGAN